MTLASVDQMFSGAAKRRYKTVTLPVAGFTLRLQSLTEKDYANYQAFFLDKHGKPVPDRLKQASRIFISMCVVDAEGNRITSPSWPIGTRPMRHSYTASAASTPESAKRTSRGW
jgi:hypothetical protein